MKCKYYKPHFGTILHYLTCLYSIEGPEGGMLHIIVADGNLTDSDIQYCLDYCEKNKDRKGYEIGKLICNELKKLSLSERKVIYELSQYDFECVDEKCCKCWAIADKGEA